MDDFSDDDFEDLNANALEELENGAIQFTQAQKKYESSQELLAFDFDDDDLDDSVVHDELRGKSVQSVPHPETLKPTTTSARLAQPAPLHDGWGPVPAGHFRPQPVGATSRPPAQLPNRLAQAPQYRNTQIRPPPPLPRPTPRRQPSQATQGPPETVSRDQAALLARIRELESRLTSKDGEIQIVRNRLDKDRADHDRELQTLRKQTAEQIAKQDRLVEAAKAAERTASTELQFTRRDLQEETRAKRKEKDGGTPKKNPAAKSWGVSDGFEDVEKVASPSRRNRGKNAGPVASVVTEPPARVARTPTKGKRKRLINGSPVQALETTEDVAMDPVVATELVQACATMPTHSKHLSDFLKIILNHRAAHESPLAFESLARFALPSNPSQSLASRLFQKLGVMGDPSDPMRLPLEFCEQVISLWEDCYQEDCFEPIPELVSLLSFTLQLHTIAIAPHIAPSLLDVAQRSCYDIVMARYLSRGPREVSGPTKKNLEAYISTTDVLSLLYLTSLGCATSQPVGGSLSPPIVDYWRSVWPEVVLALLSQGHLQPDFMICLKLLRTSVFADTLGPIVPERKTADEMADPIVDRGSLYLVEAPRWNLDAAGLRSVRSEILKTLAAFATSPFGMRHLKASDFAIPRLVVLLCGCIDEMYDGETAREYGLSPAALEEDALPAGLFAMLPFSAPPTDGLSTLLSHTVLLLHTIVTDKASEVNVPGKLARVTGGAHKYVLSLARLTFADPEDGLLGVNEETADLAHELLELVVTKEEGAGLGVFFGA